MKTVMNIIIFFLVGLIAFEGALAEHSKNEQTPEMISKKCIAKTGVLPAELSLLKKGDFSKIIKPSAHLQCYIKCIMDHEKLLEEEKINENAIQNKFAKTVPKADLEKAMKSCVHFKGKNHCEAAYNMAKCYADNKVKLI